MDQDAAERLVGHRQGDGLAALHLEVVGRGIHLEALCRLSLHGVVGSILQRDKDAAILAGGNGVDEFIVHLADLEGGVGDALTGIGGVDLDDFHTAHALIVKGEVLPLALLNKDTLGGSIQHKAVCRLGLPCDDGSPGGKVGEDDLAVSVGDILPVAGP